MPRYDAESVELLAMRRAVELALRGLGATSPNPIVGCVVLDADGSVVGEGFHQRAGGPHAEVVALGAAADRSRGGTAVVTLEPCRHVGRTPPCTEALLAAGVARVVFAVPDPDAAAGGGAEVLRAAGVEVAGGVLFTEAQRANEAWLHAVRTGRPFVTWKFAATLDGRVAAADGSSRWITGPAARADVHRLRAECDAVLVGTGTVLADDPSLTVRDAAGSPSDRRPIRVIAGLREVPASARVRDGAAPTVFVRERDPALVLKELAEREVVSVLLEGGPTLAAAFVAAGLVDRVVGYLAPKFVGAGAALLGDVGIGTIGDAAQWRIDEYGMVGDDIRLVARPLREAAPNPAKG
jgi:diaminohydroxyphosphoribosylaminopyrimidine deaminase/5-amino-6-(5-phosphoribosylamino)uracil reductase